VQVLRWRSSEAEGGAECASNGRSSVRLCVASAATELQLQEREVVHGHRPVTRVHGQRREKRLAERSSVVGAHERFDFAEVSQERQIRCWILITVRKRDLLTVHLNTTRLP